MAELPFMMMNWKRFFNSERVQDLPGGEARGLYALLLGVMWRRGGWIKADDHIIAKALDIDIRRWRQTYKPMLEPLLRREIDPHIGEVYTQSTLTEVRASALDVIDKNKARTARATAARAAKSTKRHSVTSPPPSNVTSNVTEAVTTDVATTKPTTNKERTLPIKKAESSFQPTGQALGASSGEIVASGIDPAALASLHRKGAALTPPSPALLSTPIVKGKGNGKPTEPHPDSSGGRDDQEPLPEPPRAERTDTPALGLFGALEAAIRAAKPDDDK